MKLVRYLSTSLLTLPLFIFLTLPFVFPFLPAQLSWVTSIGKRIFLNRESMWVAYTGIVAAIAIIVAIFNPIFIDWRRRSEMKKNLRNGLKLELKRNIEYIFKGDVERVVDRSIYDELTKNNDFISDIDAFETIASLYKESEFYERICRDWRKRNPEIVTEKHANLYAHYLFQIGNKENKEWISKIKTSKAESIDRLSKIKHIEIKDHEASVTFIDQLIKENSSFVKYRNDLTNLYNSLKLEIESEIDYLVDKAIP